jgi:ATP-dependent Clp protease ATP-binding subunit ClpC
VLTAAVNFLGRLFGAGHRPRYASSFQQVLALARKEAERLQHNVVDTEHLLAAVLRIDDRVMTAVFVQLDIPAVMLERAQAWSPSTNKAVRKPGRTVDHTPAVKQCLAIAIKEAEYLQHMLVGAEHIFFSLVRRDAMTVANVLDRRLLGPARVREAIRTVHGAPSGG